MKKVVQNCELQTQKQLTPRYKRGGEEIVSYKPVGRSGRLKNNQPLRYKRAKMYTVKILVYLERKIKPT